jgi:hypothetical protein
LVVANNVSYAAEPMEGATPSEVESAVADRSSQILSRELVIDYGQGELVVPLGTIGFSYDQPATRAAILSARHEGSVWRQFSSWASGGLLIDEIEEQWSFDPEQARVALDDHPGLTPIVVTEPMINPDGSGLLTLVPGVIGTEADIDAIVEQLGEVDLIEPPDRLIIDVEEIHPTVTDAQAQETVDRLNEVTGDSCPAAAAPFRHRWG